MILSGARGSRPDILRLASIILALAFSAKGHYNHDMFSCRRRFAIYLMLCLVCTPLRSQTASKSSDPPPDYSKEAFVIDQDVSKVTFENDGTGTRESSFRIRVQSDAGVQRYSVLSFPYSEKEETIEVVYVRVIKPDGTAVPTPEENILDMPSEVTRQAPFYSDQHEKHIAVKGLTTGDILEAQIRWRVTKPLVPGQFWYAFNWSPDFIVLHQELQISVPRDRAVKFKSPPTSKPVVTEEGSRRLFQWTNSRLVHLPAEEQKANQEGLVYQSVRGRLPPPDMQLSSFQTWQEVGEWYDRLQQDRVKPTPEIRTKAAELTKNAVDDDAKMQAIYNYVSTQFRYIGIAFGAGRYQPHAAEDVLSNQYGDCKDKHTLLASLLEAAGIKAYPALIGTTHDLDLDVPSPQQFDHVITAVPQGKGLLWLDSTAEVAPFGYLIGWLRGKNALVLPSGEAARFAMTPEGSTTKAVHKFSMDAQLEDSGLLKGKIEQSVQGDDVEILLRRAFRATSQEKWKELVQRFSETSGFSGEVSNVSVSDPARTSEPWRVTYDYTRKDFPDWANHQVAVAVPVLILPEAYDTSTGNTPPIYLGPESTSNFHSKVTLPKGFSAVVPSTIDLKEDFAEYRTTYSFQEGALLTDRNLTTKLADVPETETEAYKRFKKKVDDDQNRYVQTSSGTSKNSPSGWQAVGIWTQTLPLCENSEAQSAEDEAREAMLRHGNLNGVLEPLEREVALAPACTRAWMMLANAQYFSGNKQKALASFHKATDSDPSEPLPLRALAYVMFDLKKYDEEVDIWKQVLKLAPDDPEATVVLPSLLARTNHYPEAVAAYQTAIKLKPDDTFLWVRMGDTYLKLEDETKALGAYKKAVELDASALVFNDIGYALADANHQLPLALEYTEKAVQQVEAASATVKLDNLTLKDVGHTDSLAAYWDSLGWVHFRMGNYEKAEKYLLTAWAIGQAGDQADHLGQLYEKLNKKQSAARMYRLALNAPTPAVDIEAIQARLDKLEKAGITTSDDMRDEFNKYRTFPLAALTKESAAAEFFVLIGPDTKIADTKFISGSDKVKSAELALRKINFKLTFPDDGPTHLVRRGIVSCYPVTGCTFVLYNLRDVRSVN
jgi:tetratricopeptide (TPR) repeat protein/transglutaminase-like putative cysteine protease